MELEFNIDTITVLEDVTSTQDIAKALAESGGGVQSALVQARTQNAGRGRYERRWSSLEGGLYISLLLHPRKEAENILRLSVKTGEAVSKTLKQLYGIKTKIKLPNDVLAFDNGKYKKIAGILIESSSGQGGLNWLVIGVGVNLNNVLPKDLEAVSVKKIISKPVNIEEFRDNFLKNFAENYLIWQVSL